MYSLLYKEILSTKQSIFVPICVCLYAHSVSHVRPFATPRTVALKAPLSLGFPSQEWSGLPLPSPGDLPILGIKSTSFMSLALVGRFFTTALPGKPHYNFNLIALFHIIFYKL